MKQADRHRTGQQAHHAGERNQPQIMLVTETIQNLVHDRPSPPACNDHGNGFIWSNCCGFVARMVNKFFE